MKTGSTSTVQGRPMVIPRWMVHAAGLGLLGLLLAVGALRLSGWNPSVEPGAVVVQRSLRFADMPDGAVQVVDTATGQTLALMHGEQGFLRGILRGLARERRQHSVGSAPPYLLSLRDDGRLLIADPSTGQRIDLASFGPDNAAVFARWLPSQNRLTGPTGVTQP